jgi:hypothetical protein
MKNSDYLNINQRIIAVFLYTGIFLLLCRFFSGSWSFLVNTDSHYNLLFISGALLLVFGTYIAEPFFTKPVDVITNSTAVVLALLSIQDPSSLIGYWIVFYSSVGIGLSAVATIFLSQFHGFEKFQKVFFEIITKIGQSRIIFSVIYLLTIISYFGDEPIAFIFFFTFWIVFVTKNIVEVLIVWFSKVFQFLLYSKRGSEILGEAIGCENPFLYKVEIDYFKHKVKETKKGELVYLSLDNSKGAVGIIINEKQLLNKKWVTVYLLEKDNAPLKIDLKRQEFISGSRTIFSKDNAVYGLNLDDIEDSESKELVQENYLYKNRNNFIGYIAEGSDIHKVRFHALLDSTSEKYKLLKEGTVIKTGIHTDNVLYQIIDGKTYEEELEKHSIYGFLTGIAQKLGKYNTANQELEVVKWLPNIYAPVFFDDTEPSQPNVLSIGKLPETQLEIALKDVNSLVTHNTAILGILGIGKSCLTFELVKKAVESTNVKVVCIDITNEYKRELIQYLDSSLLQEELPEETLKELKDGNKNGNQDDPTSWGNEEVYKTKLDEKLKEFSEDDTKKVLLLNPDWHSVSKAGSQFKISHKIDLTIAEKTRIISERLFVLAKNEWENLSDDEIKEPKARHLLVFEEAHSLIPEWNSTANSGDQSASNGTAKVILQGRKYGLGSFVVTQRTANISKSILNQCNTIFALRVFDDTGKQFLENYIGSDYSNTLPTLEERHAIAVGKALKLKQPVIIRLNDRNDIINTGNE